MSISNEKSSIIEKSGKKNIKMNLVWVETLSVTLCRKGGRTYYKRKNISI